MKQATPEQIVAFFMRGEAMTDACVVCKRAELEAEIERLLALLTDTVASMERGGFHVALQERIRAALKDTKP